MSKYGSVRTTIDNVTFASKREARRYAELKLLLKAGEIRDLELQPVYRLEVVRPSGWDEAGRHVPSAPGEMIEIGKYIADFRYRLKDGTLVVEDSKGVRTALYSWKRKHVEAQYAIRITEV